MCSIETLPNGVRIVTERIDTVRSAALGIWIGGGSREETAAESGAAHFIEHMLFKGTATRSAQDIARETDAIGGQMNAFTTKECTCFYARVLDEHLAQATDILCDMVYHSAFAQSSVETERGVILEEIDMYEDTPDDLCAEKLFGAVFQGSPLARPILGVPETLATMTGDSLKAYHHSHYRGDNTVVALAGSFTQADLADLRQRFSALPAGQPQPVVPAKYTPAFVATPKPIEQNHLTLAFPGLDYNSPRRFALQLLSSILGGGVSSRLFQRIREEMGAAYSVYSFPSTYTNCGTFTVYAGTSPETAQQVADELLGQIRLLRDGGVTQEEFDMAKEQLKVSYVLGLESSSARMSAIGRSKLLRGHAVDPQDVIRKIEAVTKEDVERVAHRMFGRPFSASAVGRNIDGLKLL